MGVSKQDHIIIVGAGAFGLSTALHLSQNGYSNITVFEQDDEVPSRYSAANDLNKIMRVEYEDPWYTDLTMEAAEAWRKPLFAPYFHRVGFLHCASGKAEQKAVDTLNRFRGAAERHPGLSRFVVPLDSRRDIQDSAWQLEGSLPGWKGYLNRFDGYTHSADALRAVHRATSRAGVRFVLGRAAGAVEEIVRDAGRQGRAAGVRTRDGRLHAAALVVVAAGAVASKLVPGAGGFVHAKSWAVAHVQLTPEEGAALRGIPVVYARDLGFFFEPDPATNLLKLCPMGAGIVNTDRATGVSLPPAQRSASLGFLPAGDEAKLRELLRQTLPALADRPFVQNSLCWFADTADSDFVVDYVPGSSGSVVLLSGDSGHGFKMFPIVGKWVTELLASPNGQANARWRWKEAPEGGDWGSAVSWRVGTTTEFADIPRAGKESKL
ncbi:putative sarcosine oxidase [Diaporthe ampelina]|uniref:Putative sarcosine oxidase n=1 Tax=Diaporthe ampelina TaxID=1214573 RepID=A0A0G2HK62_9PEZI|nr:putative sarcosine oxidase [Diaporthe ampelina]